MPCSVIVGAFWGDEGKGKIISYLALKDNLDFCVRTGSVNAAHTVWYEGKKYALHMVPAAFINPKTRLLISAGANVHIGQFQKEMELTQVDAKRIGIDQNASIIEQKHSDQDKASAVNKGIGTTGWGVGPAIEERVRRTAKLAKDMPELKAVPLRWNPRSQRRLRRGQKRNFRRYTGFHVVTFLKRWLPIRHWQRYRCIRNRFRSRRRPHTSRRRHSRLQVIHNPSRCRTATGRNHQRKKLRNAAGSKLRQAQDATAAQPHSTLT